MYVLLRPTASPLHIITGHGSHSARGVGVLKPAVHLRSWTTAGMCGCGMGAWMFVEGSGVGLDLGPIPDESTEVCDLVSILRMLSHIPVHLSFLHYALVGFGSPCTMLSSKMYSRFVVSVPLLGRPLPSLHHIVHASTKVPCCIPEMSIMN